MGFFSFGTGYRFGAIFNPPRTNPLGTIPRSFAQENGLRTQLCSIIAGCALFVGPPGVPPAAPHEVRVPLHDGKLSLADLSAKLLREIHVPTSHLPAGQINLRGVGGSLFIQAMNRSLGDGCR